MTLAIRLATADDAALLAPLMAAFNAHEGIAWRPAEMGAAFADLCATPSLGFALVADDGAPLGYAVVTYNFDLEWHGRDAFVTELFVAEGARRRGIGAILLHAAEREARTHDARALHLLVAPENHAAQALYRARGFEASPRIMMTKPLGAP